MSLAKLTAISTKTLSLLLERQRLQTLPSYNSEGSATANGSSLHYPQIKKNLNQLRAGIIGLEAKEGPTSEAAKLLHNQYDRMRGMLWEEERAEIPRFVLLLNFRALLYFPHILMPLGQHPPQTVSLHIFRTYSCSLVNSSHCGLFSPVSISQFAERAISLTLTGTHKTNRTHTFEHTRLLVHPTDVCTVYR